MTIPLAMVTQPFQPVREAHTQRYWSIPFVALALHEASTTKCFDHGRTSGNCQVTRGDDLGVVQMLALRQGDFFVDRPRYQVVQGPFFCQGETSEVSSRDMLRLASPTPKDSLGCSVLWPLVSSHLIASLGANCYSVVESLSLLVTNFVVYSTWGKLGEGPKERNFAIHP
ncbi:hypothetical protein BGZ63DRAFT_206177 [Mariannaea sp. PMI_226]|nr:hypothetical protein BGZ63DRAFT_206177 [Mariannaea sp. PMI_226]